MIIFFIFNGPLLAKQIYLIYISILVSNVIITLLTPPTAWTLLIILIVWDIIAVLTPCGPLNLLIKLIQKRKHNKENVYLPPVLIYSTIIINQQNEFDDDDDDLLLHRPSLGLGDFIFYSLLVGQVRQLYTLVTVWFSSLCLLSGLITTLICLLKFNRPLPALPISLSIALFSLLIFHFCTEPFAQYLNTNLIFI